VWEAATGRELLTLEGHRSCVESVAWSPDGQRLATGSVDNTAKVWEAATGRELLTFFDHQDRITSVAWSPDGKRLATGSWDQTAKAWAATTRSTASAATGFALAAPRREVLTLNGHVDSVSSVSWSPDGKRLATGSADNTAKVWDAGTGRELLTLKGHEDNVDNVSWSPDGRRLATGSRDSTAKVWDAETGRELLTLKGHESWVRSVAWSPDGERLATAGKDGIVQVFAMDIDLLMSLARSRVTRNLTLEECRKYLHTDEVPPIPFG
jgi:WD40 repeat protein